MMFSSYIINIGSGFSVFLLDSFLTASNMAVSIFPFLFYLIEKLILSIVELPLPVIRL